MYLYKVCSSGQVFLFHEHQTVEDLIRKISSDFNRRPENVVLKYTLEGSPINVSINDHLTIFKLNAIRNPTLTLQVSFNFLSFGDFHSFLTRLIHFAKIDIPLFDESPILRKNSKNFKVATIEELNKMELKPALQHIKHWQNYARLTNLLHTKSLIESLMSVQRMGPRVDVSLPKELADPLFKSFAQFDITEISCELYLRDSNLDLVLKGRSNWIDSIFSFEVVHPSPILLGFQGVFKKSDQKNEFLFKGTIIVHTHNDLDFINALLKTHESNQKHELHIHLYELNSHFASNYVGSVDPLLMCFERKLK